MPSKNYKSGFTLIELSIVLVIIGLIVGGVLVGQDLISAARVRSQISQIEQYNIAVNTFKIKYGYLPGDIPDPAASGFGFDVRGTKRGQGNGNGVIEGNCEYQVISLSCGEAYALAGSQGSGETGLFWVDLSDARLINSNFITASCCTYQYTVTPTTTPAVKDLLPTAKIGDNYSVLVTNGKLLGGMASALGTVNFFTIEQVIAFTVSKEITAAPSVRVIDAYNIDSKIDDGLPQTGSVLAIYINNSASWNAYMRWVGASGTTQTQASPTTCYDNGNVNGDVQKYSVGQNGGNGKNCALSFKFQ